MKCKEETLESEGVSLHQGLKYETYRKVFSGRTESLQLQVLTEQECVKLSRVHKYFSHSLWFGLRRLNSGTSHVRDRLMNEFSCVSEIWHSGVTRCFGNELTQRSTATPLQLHGLRQLISSGTWSLHASWATSPPSHTADHISLTVRDACGHVVNVNAS